MADKVIGIDLGTTNSVVAVMEGGDPVVMKGRFTAVGKQIDGKWQYVADQASAEPAPPPAAAPAAKP